MIRLFALTVLICCYVTLCGQQITIIDSSVRLTLDSLTTADVPANAPGVAVAIIEGSKILYEKYAGYSDLNDSIRISGDARFNIASNGKQFTALAILILENKKQLNLRDDIRRYFPSLFPNIKATITIENLLNHSSGIRDVYDLLSLQGITWWKQTMSNADIYKMIEKQHSLNFDPGSQYLYSNSNYILLALLVEKITGRSFVEFTTSMFNDLNMQNTSFEADYKKIKGPIAKPYFNFSTWSNYNWIWNANGDWNLFSTLPDLIQWEKIVNGSVKCNIPARVIERSQQLTGNQQIKNYGYGIEFRTYKGVDINQHEGATGAWKAFFVRVPSKKLSFITLTNSGKVIPSYQTMPSLDLLLNLKPNESFYPIRPERSGSQISDDDIPGVYTNGGAFYFEFVKKDNDIVLRRNGRNDVKLVRETTNIFRQLYDSTFRQKFTRDSLGRLCVTAYHPSHAPYVLTKQNQDWKNVNADRLKGRFTNAETGSSFEIKDLMGQTVSIEMNGRINNGLLITSDKIVFNGYYLTFDPSRVDKFYLNGDRIRRIEFNRQ